MLMDKINVAKSGADLGGFGGCSGTTPPPPPGVRKKFFCFKNTKNGTKTYITRH